MDIITADRPLAELIPEPGAIRRALDRAEEEAGLLRKLLRLSLARQEQAARLAHEYEHRRGGNA